MIFHFKSDKGCQLPDERINDGLFSNPRSFTSFAFFSILNGNRVHMIYVESFNGEKNVLVHIFRINPHRSHLQQPFVSSSFFFKNNFFSQQVKQLEALIQSANMKRDLMLSPVPRPAPSTSIHYHQTGSFYVHKEHIKSLPFSSKLNG